MRICGPCPPTHKCSTFTAADVFSAARSKNRAAPPPARLPMFKTLFLLIRKIFCHSADDKKTYNATGKYVFDGDSFTAVREGQTEPHEIRLFGIDAPERGQEYAKQAREHLIRLVRKKKLRVEVWDTDSYGRDVAKVYAGGIYVNLEMLRAGYAWHYSYHAGGDKELAEAEQEAKEARIGLWQADAPIPPRKWRRMHSAKKHSRKFYCN